MSLSYKLFLYLILKFSKICSILLILNNDFGLCRLFFFLCLCSSLCFRCSFLHNRFCLLNNSLCCCLCNFFCLLFYNFCFLCCCLSNIPDF